MWIVDAELGDFSDLLLSNDVADMAENESLTPVSENLPRRLRDAMVFGHSSPSHLHSGSPSNRQATKRLRGLESEMHVEAVTHIGSLPLSQVAACFVCNYGCLHGED